MLLELSQKLDQYVMVIFEKLTQFFNWIDALMKNNTGMVFGGVLVASFVAIMLLIGLIRFVRKAFGLFIFFVVIISVYILICMLFI